MRSHLQGLCCVSCLVRNCKERGIAIRFALEPGFRQERLADDTVEGRAVHVVRVTDPSGQATTFSMAKDDFAILRLGFETARGWHERLYSDFFRKPGVPEAINLQPAGSQTKAYQVRQARKVLETHRLV